MEQVKRRGVGRFQQRVKGRTEANLQERREDEA